MREEAIEAVAYLRAKRDESEFSSAESGGWPERYKEGGLVRRRWFWECERREKKSLRECEERKKVWE